MQNLHPPLQRVKVFAKCKAIPTKYNISHKTANFESRGPPLYDGVRITEILYQLPYRSLNCLAILWSNLKCHIWSFTEWIRSNDFSFDFEWVVCTFDSWVFKAYWLGRRQKYGNGDSHCGTTYLCTTKKKLPGCLSSQKSLTIWRNLLSKTRSNYALVSIKLNSWYEIFDRIFILKI